MTARAAWKADAQSELLSAARDLDECADWFEAQYTIQKSFDRKSPVSIRIKRYRARAVKLREIAGRA